MKKINIKFSELLVTRKFQQVNFHILLMVSDTISLFSSAMSYMDFLYPQNEPGFVYTKDMVDEMQRIL